MRFNHFIVYLLAIKLIACQQTETIAPVFSIPTRSNLAANITKQDSSKICGQKELSVDRTHYVYLTFDDGPHASTPDIVNLLTSRNVKSSFFIIGDHITRSEKNRLIYEFLKNTPNCKMYNHTHTHAITNGQYSNYYQYPEAVWQDIHNNKVFMPADARITRLPGTNAFRMKNYRFPSKGVGGNMIRYLDSIKSTEALLGWHFEWTSRESTDTAAVSAMIAAVATDTTRQHPFQRHTIILFHDFHFKSTASLNLLARFIDELQVKYHCTFRWAEEFPDIHVPM